MQTHTVSRICKTYRCPPKHKNFGEIFFWQKKVLSGHGLRKNTKYFMGSCIVHHEPCTLNETPYVFFNLIIGADQRQARAEEGSDQAAAGGNVAGGGKINV